MSDHFNGLSPAEAERLAVLAEECGEIVQIVMKAMRHGLDFHHPETGETNRAAIARELGDLDAICGRMVLAHDIDAPTIKAASSAKAEKLKRWTHSNGLRLLRKLISFDRDRDMSFAEAVDDIASANTALQSLKAELENTNG